MRNANACDGSAKRKMPKKISYRDDVLNDLRGNVGYASEYLSAAYADSQESFLVALRDVAEARKGIAKVAKRTKLNRENLYRSLSKHGNPTLSTLAGVLEAVGLCLAVVPKNVEVATSIATTPAPAQVQEASAVRISANVAGSATDLASAWTIGNLATSATELVEENKPSREQLSDVPVYLLAGQMAERQEAEQG